MSISQFQVYSQTSRWADLGRLPGSSGSGGDWVGEWMAKKGSCLVYSSLPSDGSLTCACFTFLLHTVTYEAHWSQWTLLITSPTGFSSLLLNQGHTWHAYCIRIILFEFFGQRRRKAPHKISSRWVALVARAMSDTLQWLRTNPYLFWRWETWGLNREMLLEFMFPAPAPPF